MEVPSCSGGRSCQGWKNASLGELALEPLADGKAYGVVLARSRWQTLYQ